jgi:Protein of unknown function (DUF4239)
MAARLEEAMVNPMTIGCIIMACVFGGALTGMVLRLILPEHHLSADSKDVVRLGVGLIATMSALVLALLVASAKSSYDAQKNEVTQISANIVLLDLALAHYGPETKDIRAQLRPAVTTMIDQIWSKSRSNAAKLAPKTTGGDRIYDAIQGLAPQNEAQRALQAQAEKVGFDIAQTRWLLFDQASSSIPMPFLIMLVFWVTIIFLSFGLFAPRNATVIATLFLCAFSVSGAIFLILELDRPFGGLIEISDTPMRNAIAHLGQ